MDLDYLDFVLKLFVWLVLAVFFGVIGSLAIRPAPAAEQCEYSCTELRIASHAPKWMRDAYLARTSKAQIAACCAKCFGREQKECR